MDDTKKGQLDLNNPLHLAQAGLEDPVLVGHMNDARRQYRASELARIAERAERAELDKKGDSARKEASLAATSLAAVRVAMAGASADALALARTLEREKQDAPPLDPASRASRLCEQVEELGADLAAAERNLTVARRAYEDTIAGLMLLLDAH